jgi:hypothetical protein
MPSRTRESGRTPANVSFKRRIKSGLFGSRASRSSRHFNVGCLVSLYTAYATSIRCVIPEYKVNLDKLIQLLLEEKRTNPSNYALVVLSEGAEWEGYKLQEYGEPDAYGHRKKASVAESLADEIKRRVGEETITSDLTYDLRSGDPDFIDKLVALTFGNMAYDAILEGKTGLMSALVEGRYDLVPIPDAKLGPRTLDVASTYNTERYRPICATSAGCRSFSTARHSVAGGNPIAGMAGCCGCVAAAPPRNLISLASQQLAL